MISDLTQIDKKVYEYLVARYSKVKQLRLKVGTEK